jgi:Class III cytochrome C family
LSMSEAGRISRRGSMRYGKCLFVLAIICLFVVPLAFSQEAVMVLDHKEIGPHQRPLIQFNHEKHSTNLECLRCHHDYDKYGNVRGSEGQACIECHGKTAGKKYTPLTDLFHVQCKSCHEAMRARGEPSGPVMCGECHVRK